MVGHGKSSQSMYFTTLEGRDPVCFPTFNSHCTYDKVRRVSHSRFIELIVAHPHRDLVLGATDL